VDSAGNAVLQLEVHLGDRVLSEDGGLGDITYKDVPLDRMFIELFVGIAGRRNS